MSAQPQELVVGKMYKVKCIRGKISAYMSWWPILGDLHEDRELIGFPHDHAHVDARFLTDPQAEFLSFRGVFSTPLQIGNTLNEQGPLQEKFRWLRCRRVMPEYPVGAAPWLSKMEQVYASAKLKGMRCPHRGVDLTSCPRLPGNVVTCPLHGLSWDATNGGIVPRETVIRLRGIR